MSLYKEIIPFIDYLVSIRKLENYLSFDMKFPIKWSIPKSVMEESNSVPFDVGDNNFKGWSIVSQTNEKDVSSVLTKIAKIIKLNKEKEIKEKLFRETIEKLKQTFETTDLDKLQNLYFDFETDIDTPSDDGQDNPTTLELVD